MSGEHATRVPARSQPSWAPISGDGPRWKIWLALAVLVAVGVAALVAIASREGGSEPLSREEFATRLDAICAEYFERADPDPAPSSLDEVVAFIEGQAIPNADRAAAEMRKLNPPDELDTTFRELLLVFDVVVRSTEEALDDVKQGNVSAFTDLGTRLQPTVDHANELARELGADTCAEE